MLHQSSKTALDFIDKKIQDYSARYTSPSGDLLQRIDRETHLHVMRPRMLSGHEQGRLLSMISHMVRPELVLEIGTYTGYSALCMAEGLAENGKLITIDINEELEDLVRGYFESSIYHHQIEYRVGNALDILPRLDETYDLVFIDADKVNYLIYYRMIIDKMKPGGFIIADNILWSGKVLETPESNDKDTRALIEFNDTVHQDPRVENVLLPIRDGLMILRIL